MTRYLLYDLEIIKCIPLSTEIKERYECCSGWTDFENMGISIIGYSLFEDLDWNNRPETYSFYNLIGEDPFKEDSFQDLLNKTDVLVGFNNHNFDDRLLEANGYNLPKVSIDLLREIRFAAFGSTDWKDQPKGWTYKLTYLCEHNKIGEKTGAGDLAPILFQQGRHAEVIDYCLNDVAFTLGLMQKFYQGNLRDPNSNETLKWRTFNKTYRVNP